MQIAVIGSGITGLSAAWLLAKRHDVVLFEADSRLGGHSNTVEVAAPEGVCPVDTGFIVYNAASYPNLVAFFEHLNVLTDPTDMSFAVSFDEGAYEYSGTGLSGLFGQRRNVLNVRHWVVLKEAMRFFREARTSIADGSADDISLGQWLEDRRYARAFIDEHIVPMGAAIWSTPAEDMLDFPFTAFARFFSNHGLLQAFNRPIWRTVRGGSREYIKRILADFPGKVAPGEAVSGIERAGGKVIVQTAGAHAGAYDGVVLACHADDALRLYKNADDETRALLSAFHYARNTAVLHTDATLMPKRRRVWSSWNYLASRPATAGAAVPVKPHLSVSYWMNSLQRLATAQDYFVTLNPYREPKAGSVARSFVYHHPMFDIGALNAQKNLWRVQGRNGVWLAGSYCGSGFHEDGLQAGLWAAEDCSRALSGPSEGVRRPWTLDNPSNRICVPPSEHSSRRREAAE